jgi:hypothetical protein
MSDVEADSQRDALRDVVPAVGDAPISHSDVTDDVELWLLRVPRHKLLRESLVGTDIALSTFTQDLEPVSHCQSQPLSHGDDTQPYNAIRGNYRFKDTGLSATAMSVRAAFPADTDNGPAFKIGTASISHHVAPHDHVAYVH